MEQYCIQDTLVTEKLYQHLTSELTRMNFDERSIKLEHDVQTIIATQEETDSNSMKQKLSLFYQRCKVSWLFLRLSFKTFFQPRQPYESPTKQVKNSSQKSKSSTQAVGNKSEKGSSRKAGSQEVHRKRSTNRRRRDARRLRVS